VNDLRFMAAPRIHGTTAGIDANAQVRRDASVEISLNALVEQIDDHLFARGTREFRLATGKPDQTGGPERLAELTRADVFQYISELIASPRTDDAKRARLVLLQRYVADQFVEAHTATQREALDTWLHTHRFESGASSWSIPGASQELPRLALREHRVALERELSAAVMEGQSRWTRLGDAMLQAMTALRPGLSPVGFIELSHGSPLKARCEQALSVLTSTRDAYEDLLGFALKRVDPQLKVRHAAAHDVERAALAPWLVEWFRREDLEHALTRTLGDLNFSPSAEGRLTVDVARATEGRAPGATVLELRVPEQIRLALTVDSGLDCYSAWLRGWGVALHRAHVNHTLPLVERRLGDAAVIEGFGRVFSSFLLEEGWLKRYLRLTAHQAREASRMASFHQLLELRVAAARLLVHADFLERGATTALVEDAVPRWADALGAEVPRGRTFTGLDRWGHSTRVLDGFSLEQVLHTTLLERFNEDYYRNPATGRWLLDLASRGQRDDAMTLASWVAELATPSREVLSLTAAAKRRVDRMGA
jgi:hypothetical protein